MPPLSLPPIEIFCSYAPADEALFKDLEAHLSALSLQGRGIALWHRHQITGGTDWKQEQDVHLNQAVLILLLISPAFFTPDSGCTLEMQRALERQATGTTRVVPIVLRPVAYQDAPFAHLSVLPNNNLPITSWTNQDEAFKHVAQHLRRVLDELGILPVSMPVASAFPSLAAPSEPIWNIPFPRKRFFTGREDLLKKLHTRAFGQPQTISGLGGIGKTQLAVEYAYRYRQEYQAVLWVRAETREALTTSYAEIADLLQIPQKNDWVRAEMREALTTPYAEIADLLQIPQKNDQEQKKMVQGVKDWLSSHQNWLLILDNADEPDVLIPFLPLQVRGHLIVTTRAPGLSNLGLGFGHALTVQKFTKQQDVPFLLRRAGLKRISSQERQYARHIADELDGLPLALNQAGMYIAKTGCSLADYWPLYQQKRPLLLNTHEDQEYPNSVAKALLLSFERVEQRSSAAADLLRLCAFLAPDALPEELLTKGACELGDELAFVAEDAYQLNRAFADLRAYSLLTRDAPSRTFTVHRLVQAVLRDSMAPELQQQWMKRAILAVNAAFPDIEFEDWATCERLLPHAFTCATWIKQAQLVTSEACHLLNQIGWYLRERGQYTEAEPLFLHALEQLGVTHTDTARTLNNLGELYRQQGKHGEAELLLLRALSIREQELGPDDPDTARTLNNLAILCWQQSKYKRAEQLFLRARSIYEKYLVTEHSYTAKSRVGLARNLIGLANLYHVQENYEEAEPLYLQALLICEQHLRADHPYIAAARNNLAELYRVQGKYKQAEQLYLHALSIVEKQFGPNHPDTARILNNLAQLYLQQGKDEQVEPLFLRTLSIYEKSLVADHLDTAEARHRLGKLYQRQGKYKQAEPLLKRALATYESVLGQEHPMAQTVRENYTALLPTMEYDAEAKQSEVEP